MRHVALLAPVLSIAFVVACGDPRPPAAAPPPPPLVALPPVSPPPPVAATPPPGERWLTPEAAAHVKLTKPLVPRGYVVAAGVDLDEQHRAQIQPVHSGVVTSIAARPGMRVKKGDILLTIERGNKALEPIRSLIDGEVASIDARIGDAVSGADRDPKIATRLAVVENLDKVVLTMGPVPPGVFPGAPVEFIADSMENRVFTGVVSYLSTDHAQLRCDLANFDHSLRPGMRGMLRIEQRGLPSVPGLEIPRSALIPGSTVVLVKGGAAPDGRVRFVETRVATSFDGASRYLLVTGLSEDAEIVWDASKL